jgi:hypothetical protein
MATATNNALTRKKAAVRPMNMPTSAKPKQTQKAFREYHGTILQAGDGARPPNTLTSLSDALERERIGDVIENLQPLLKEIDKKRAAAVLEDTLAAVVPMQEAAKAQMLLKQKNILRVLSQVPFSTAIELGTKAGSSNPEHLVAQWVKRRKVYGLNFAGTGMRYPNFLFDPVSGKPHEAAKEFLPTLLDNLNPIDLTLWFVNPQREGEPRPADVLDKPEVFKQMVQHLLAPLDAW